MRKINAKQFLKILKGEDLEFRISPFPFSLNEPACVREIHLPYDLNFSHCEFENVVFHRCRFSGNIAFVKSSIENLNLSECHLHNLNIETSSIDSFEIKASSELKELIIKASDINSILIDCNPIYETIHIGCENNVRDCHISKNGDSEKNSFLTKVFICPERFESMSLTDLITDALHIGTFGEYAKLIVKNVLAEVVLIDGCSTELSKVSFENVQPLDPSVSALHFINTTFDQVVFGDSAFKNYQEIKLHHQSVDVSSLLLR